ncbi:MAG TPA: 23S rRNA (adenine(2030)-N(6))-methyltransferase RlmJ [Burkholderiaceae bacterium]|jgi:23S rRNA (adenine2030-N6)-methyltransferase|nr:23S rRNA (adenine(2030)-N(6))-methyltransferase RlmJ [Burkholderiaceae bacterium]
MLAYRHAFHAGNHADVLKHLVFAEVLRHMAAKDKPFTVVDTHAGAGGYSLESRYAQRNAEATTGIERLWSRDDLPAALARYVDLVRAFNGGGQLEQYPGSPAIANLLLRPTDPLHCFELHPTDERILRAYLGPRAHAKVAHSDGFAALAHELPPPSRRGVVLIDPPYELKADYARTLAAVREALTRFATGVVLVWVPQLATVDSRELPRRLLNAAASAAGATKGALHARLTVAEPDARGFGLIGSSMVVINPPHGLAETLRAVGPYLAKVLGQFDGAAFLLDVK